MDDRNGFDLNDHQTQRELFGTILFQPEDLAGLFGVQPDTIKNWLRDGKIQGAVHLGRKWYIPDAAIKRTINQALREAGVKPTPPTRRPASVQPTNNQTPALFDTDNA